MHVPFFRWLVFWRGGGLAWRFFYDIFFSTRSVLKKLLGLSSSYPNETYIFRKKQKQNIKHFSSTSKFTFFRFVKKIVYRIGRKYFLFSVNIDIASRTLYNHPQPNEGLSC
jgi:hypothetical protein